MKLHAVVRPGRFYALPDQCFIDFAQYPIPADFFGPGSDLFVDMVSLRGVPLTDLPQCPTADLLGVRAVLERQGAIWLAWISVSLRSAKSLPPASPT